MTLLEAIILGIVQGLTEFLPISSSAHLVIVPALFGWKLDPQIVFPFDVIIQVGTLVAVIAYFWQDLWKILIAWVRGIQHRNLFETPDARLGWYILLATLPAGIAGGLLKSAVEVAFHSLTTTASFLLGTAVLLFLAEMLGKRTRSLSQMNALDAIVSGFFQALAIFPGISRSGSTITGGLLRGLDRPSAARFSFLMSIPIMLAAGAMEGLNLIREPGLWEFLPQLSAGFITAAIVGYASIHWLLGYLQRHSLRSFALYCLVVGAGILAWQILL